MRVWRFRVVGALLLAACEALKSTEGDALTTRSLTPADGGCTPRSEASGFPVKVLFVLENGGRMCVVDPPGSQGSAGFCEMFAGTLSRDGGPPLPAQPARVRVVRDFIDQSAGRPNLFVATSWFDRVGLGTPFLLAANGAPAVLSSVQGSLGGPADVQEGLADAVARLETDMSVTPSATRARTRYVVVYLGTAVASPRCSSQDTLDVWASASAPEGVWPDSTTACNEACTSNCLVGFTPGGDRNQNSQLWAAVDRLLALKTRYGVGDVRVHTRMVFDEAALAWCGPMCSGLFPPGGADIARWTLGQLALRGQGTFEAPSSLSQLSFASVDTTEFTELCPK